MSRSSPRCWRHSASSGPKSWAEQSLLGEVGLDGRLRPVRGILPATLAAQQAGFKRVIVPLRQAGEAKLVAGIEVFGVGSITPAGRFSARHPDAPVDPIEVIGERGRQAMRSAVSTSQM